MFYIKIKDRNGFYNGIQEQGGAWRSRVETEHTNTKDHPNFDSRIPLDKRVKMTTRNYVYSLPLKKNITGLKTKYAFITREAAEKEIEYIKGFMEYTKTTLNRHDTPYERQDYDYATRQRGAAYWTKTVEIADFDALNKLADKCYVHEDSETMIPKATRGKPERNKLRYWEASNTGKNFCEICKIGFTTNEIGLTISGRICICNGCIQEIAETMQEKFKAHPHAEEIKLAWQVERMLQD